MENYMEIMAYFASVVVLLSFCTKNVKLLRILNNVGCMLFIVYSTYHGRYPLVFLNLSVIAINLYYLFWGDKK